MGCSQFILRGFEVRTIDFSESMERVNRFEVMKGTVQGV